jgi:NAD-dependent dihydropyrimidine dehydrogenase PreA subunit
VFGMNGDVPVIARPEDCQTCFMCELYCRADALYVGPDHDMNGGGEISEARKKPQTKA